MLLGLRSVAIGGLDQICGHLRVLRFGRKLSLCIIDNKFLTSYNHIMHAGSPVSFKRGGSARISHVKPVTTTAEKPVAPPEHHTLGRSFDLPHAEVHQILLPHAATFNSHAAQAAVRDLAETFSELSGDAFQGVNNLLDLLGLQMALEQQRMQECDIDKAAAH